MNNTFEQSRLLRCVFNQRIGGFVFPGMNIGNGLNTDFSNRQNDLSNVLAAFHQLLRLGRFR
jgi:hypothetical protein